MSVKDFLEQVKSLDLGKIPIDAEVHFQAGWYEAYSQSSSVPVDTIEFDGCNLIIYGK